MHRYWGVFLVALGMAAEERPLPNLKILSWQVEAQARERERNRLVEYQLKKAHAVPPVPQPTNSGDAGAQIVLSRKNSA